LCLRIEAKDDLRGRALRRRVTLICAGYPGVLEQSRMTVFRRESPHSENATHRDSRWHNGIAGAPDRACPRWPHFAPSVPSGLRRRARVEDVPHEADELAGDCDVDEVRVLALIEHAPLPQGEPAQRAIGQRDRSRILLVSSLA
jgi:hypothetical protein